MQSRFSGRKTSSEVEMRMKKSVRSAVGAGTPGRERKEAGLGREKVSGRTAQ